MGRILSILALAGLLGLAGCQDQRSPHGDPTITPPRGWKDRGPLPEIDRYLAVNLCEWYSPHEQRPPGPPPVASNVAIHITNFSRHDLGSLGIEFRLHGGKLGSRTRVLHMDDYLPAHGSLYTHAALPGDPTLYPRLRGTVRSARILDTPGSR